MSESRTITYNYKTLLCTNIPELFLDKHVARTHFGRFGTLVNFVLRPRRMTCTVSYGTEAEAAQALRLGSVYNGHKFDICFAENEATPAQRTEEWMDPDVQAELNVLSAGWRSEPIAVAKSSNASINLPMSKPAAQHKTNATTERQRSSGLNAKQELEAILRKPAFTTEEKYRVLDARDKLLRLNMRRATDIKSATTTHGYCPDMCPEKERLLREFQRQVAVYELESPHGDQIAHHLAIKQYSRSSADQETPLPHELRSEAVLHMTMAYLMHEIMNKVDQAGIGDWFHFLWDRTRSIRKEITQQELCSLSAVKLVEQCARFHIHCAARLVAEDASVFDSKINAENLTKCLQTLKYMYHDLRLKNINCPREAEFRGYIVLLNLADANFLWDIGQLPVELQNCKEIKHAIKFYLALQDTNFVRFFKLLRDPETTYLSACILITYFTRLRVLTLRRLVQSYRAPRKTEVSSLPLGYMRKMLSFPSDEETKEFVNYYGLTVNNTDRVLLTRMEPPDSEYKLQRQYELVESKRLHSVGECICGEPLPPKSLYLNHRPHNSFNEQGLLVHAAWMAKDQLPSHEPEEPLVPLKEEKPTRKSPTDNLFKVPMMSAPFLPKPKPATTNMQAPQQPVASKPIFSSLMPAPATPMQQPTSTDKFGSKSMSVFANAFTEKPRLQKSFSGNIFDATPTATTDLNIFNIKTAPKDAATSTAFPIFGNLQQLHKPKPTMPKFDSHANAQQQEKLEKQKKAEEEAKLAALEQSIILAKQREAELLAKQAEIAAKAERDLIQREKELQKQLELKRQQLEQKLDKHCDKLLDTMLHNELLSLCKEEITLHKNTMQTYTQLLDNYTAEIVDKELGKADYEHRLLRSYWLKWRTYRRVKQQKSLLFHALPLSFGAQSTSQLVGDHSQIETLSMLRRYRQGQPCNFETLLQGMDNAAWLKLNLWQLLSKKLHKQMDIPGRNKYIKMLVSLPEGKPGIIYKNALDGGLLLQPLQPTAGSTYNDKAYINGVSHGVALCVRRLMDVDLLNERRQPATDVELANADGLICCLSMQQMMSTRLRLQKLCRNNIRYIAFIVLDAQTMVFDENLLVKELQLSTLHLQSYKVFSCRAKNRVRREHIIDQFHHAVKFLAAQPNPSRSALMQVELREWLISCLGNELFNRLRYVVEHDTTFAQCSRRSPQFSVSFYNEAVRRLQLVVSENLETYPQLPEELREFVEPLAFNAPPGNRLEHFIEGWQNPANRQAIVDLLEQVKLSEMPPLELSSDSSSHELEICEWILEYAQQTQEEVLVESVAMHATQSLVLEEPFDDVDYLALVEIFAQERLQFLLRRSESQLPTAVVYNKATKRKYFDTDWYYEWQKPDLEATQAQEQESMSNKDSHPTQMSEQSMDEIISRAQAVLDKVQKRKTLKELNEKRRNWEYSTDDDVMVTKHCVENDAGLLPENYLASKTPTPKRKRIN